MEREWLEWSYDEFPRIEEAFHAALEEDLRPRRPDLLYDLVRELGLAPGSSAADVGCGEGGHSFRLAERFGFDVTGLDPVPRHIEVARAGLAERGPELRARVRFEPARAESLPFADETVDLVWCRDVLGHVEEPARAYGEFHRVLRPRGRALVYQMFAGDRLEPREAEWLWSTMGVAAASADVDSTEAAIAAAGLRIDGCIDLTSEWGEWEQDRSGKPGRRLLYAARLLRDPQRYTAQFGRAAYDLMLGDCLWHVYAMIGKLDRRAYILSRA